MIRLDKSKGTHSSKSWLYLSSCSFADIKARSFSAKALSFDSFKLLQKNNNSEVKRRNPNGKINENYVKR